MTAFDTKRTGTGTKEWAETNFNIGSGCSHGCLYCYAKANALRFKTKETEDDWRNEVLTKNAFIESFSGKEGVIMFPSSHDITPGYLHHAIKVLRLMLEGGNSVLIVTKPNLYCIQEICSQLDKYREQILFRFTITSMNRKLSQFWEPGAPLPHERLDSLGYAWARNFKTSISIEPMLAGVDEAIKTVNMVDALTTDTIWIGKMNKAKLRVDTSKLEVRDECRQVEFLQRYSEILRLYETLKDNPKVRWKDSIRLVVENHGTL